MIKNVRNTIEYEQMPFCLCFPKHEEAKSSKQLLSNHYAPPIKNEQQKQQQQQQQQQHQEYELSKKRSKLVENALKKHLKGSREKLSLSEEHQECAVCYDDLCSGRTAVFVKRDGVERTCKHYFHASCARELLEHCEQETKSMRSNREIEEEDWQGGEDSVRASCPICRVRVFGYVNVPSSQTNPNLWFNIVDIDSDGKVSASDLVTILRAQFLVDWRTIEKKLMTEIWPRFDLNESGFISRDELLKADGLLDYLLKTFEQPKRRFRNCPNLELQPRKWFEYWDEDHSGTLDSEELIRALVKTFNLNAEIRSLRAMAESVRSVWGAFDQGDKGEITLDEFIAPEGLAQSIVATMRWSDYHSNPSSRHHSRISGEDLSTTRTNNDGTSNNTTAKNAAIKPKRVGILGFSRYKGGSTVDEGKDVDSLDAPPRDRRLAFLSSFISPRASYEDLDKDLEFEARHEEKENEEASAGATDSID